MTTGYSSQFLGSFPVGAIIQSPLSISDPNWLRMDGSIITRATYPALSAAYGLVGAFTPTTRTLNSTSVANSLASNGTNIVAAGATGTSAIQVSTNNGVTWAAATTPANSAPVCLCWNGTVFFSGLSNAAQSIYSATGTGTWTAVTGTASSGIGQCAARSNGAIVALGYNASVAYYSPASAAAAPVFATSTLAAGTGTITGSCIVDTGTNVIIFGYSATGVGYQYSTTGATGTWTAVSNPPWAGQIVSGATSDGAGNVVVTVGYSSIAWISNNNGTTWRQTILPGNTAGTLSGNTPNFGVSYANGRFFISGVQYFAVGAIGGFGNYYVSSDTYTWINVPGLSPFTSNAANSLGAVTYAGGNYITMLPASTTVNTATEDSTKLYLPSSNRPFDTGGSSYSVLGPSNYQDWIKVQ